METAYNPLKSFMVKVFVGSDDEEQLLCPVCALRF